MTVQIEGPDFQPHRLVPAQDTIADEQFETPSLTADDLDAIAAYFKREATETARHRAAHRRRRRAWTSALSGTPK